VGDQAFSGNPLEIAGPAKGRVAVKSGLVEKPVGHHNQLSRAL
jgi:hypothetical protein